MISVPHLRMLALLLIGTAGGVLGTAAGKSVAAAKKPLPATAQPSTPEIMMTAQNRVPACISTDRFDQLLAERNPRLEPKFHGIARLYKIHGEKLGVRWDYAFYQMILETNSLKFTGDVRARQNNFAGLGATGGGVPGESFADVSSGVLAQLQHLVAYAGIKVDSPVAKRTRDNQGDIIARSKKLGRAVRYGDLTNRWAADGRYARSIDALATLFREASCAGNVAPVAGNAPSSTALGRAASPSASGASTAVPAAIPRRGQELARRAVDEQPIRFAKPVGLGAAPPSHQTDAASVRCHVMAASFGGDQTLLIRAETAGGVTFTALGVEEPAAEMMAESYIATHARGGRVTGRFSSRDDAIARAYELCDSGRP